MALLLPYLSGQDFRTAYSPPKSYYNTMKRVDYKGKLVLDFERKKLLKWH